MTLDEALHIRIGSIEKEIVNIVKYDKDLSSRSIIAKSIIDLIHSGGKRLRPLMVIVGSRFGPLQDRKKVLRLAAVAEFIHAASLIHDDIIDDSPVRRGEPSMHTRIGKTEAVHVGDYMSSRVIELISIYSGDRERYVYDLTTLATTKLCIGEYQQMRQAYDYDISMEQYLEKSRNKTALLMATCLRIGAQAAGSDPVTAELLYSFGEKLGMSFQIRDDLLDFTQTSEKLGKPAGSDLRNGQVTLPVIYALQDEQLAPAIRAIHANSPSEEVSTVIAAILSSNALQQTEMLSQQYLQEAREIIEHLTDYPAHSDLRVLLKFFGGREY